MRRSSALRTRAALIAASTVLALAVAPVLPASASSSPAPHVADGFVRSGPAVQPNVDGLRPSGLRRLTATPPASVSLAKYTVPIGDQKQVGSCTTWAIGYSMLGWYSMRAGSTRTYAPMYLYSQINDGVDEGSSSRDAYTVLTTQGIAPRSSYSHSDYDYKHKPSKADRTAAAPNTTTAPHYLFNLWGGDTAGTAGRTAIETAVAAQHPVALAMPVYEPFELLDAKHSVLRASAITKHSQFLGGHMVLIVGYDKTGVRIQNQWGTSWGDEGYATLDWAFVEQYAWEASWIYGFSRDLPATAPAQVDRFETSMSTSSAGSGPGSADIGATWSGTGDYDDSVRHPVTGYTATLAGSDGSTQTDTLTDPADSSTSFSRLDPTVTYTLAVAAISTSGIGTPQTYTVRPADSPAGADVERGPFTAAPRPSPTMPAAGDPPATTPATPLESWPHLSASHVDLRWKAPHYTGHRKLTHFRVHVTGAKGGKTRYTHRFVLRPSAHALRVHFRGGAHRGASTMPTKLTKYRLALQAENSAGKRSTAMTVIITVHWYRNGYSESVRME